MEDGSWKMTIRLSAGTFESLKHIAKHILGDVERAKTFREWPIAGGGSGGGNSWTNYSVEYSCPAEARIAQLRREADALEASLGKPG